MSCDQPPPAQLLEGIAQFNRGDLRYLYQGILQIGVAFRHLRRLNHHGTVYMLRRGSRHLAPFAPRCRRVDVQALVDAAAAALVSGASRTE